MSATLFYSTTIPFNEAEVTRINNLIERMQKRARNGKTTINSVNGWSVTNNTVSVSLTYFNSCDINSSIKGALNKAVGAGRLH